ncbi:SWI/SNF and RSC complexes subunit ssr4 [Hypsizygus marmoreus]|uniref:SWI/SNF and RSC complexes subunit ssr4 n=1 Tax=Hypsizygus marmoreus TaxID=39966 RepID=A0A369J2N0_HYPMA|nr:SWI/SNF and RSC complexes subunit ssr4 [Hypsizygus marmoreus]
MSFQQAQAEGLCLRYPENLGLHREISYGAAVDMLLRAVSMAQTVPFGWGFVDKPAEGQVLLLFLPPQAPFPIDGLRFQDQEVKFAIPVGAGRELEVYEAKFGFIPGSQDTNAWRCRRRYRLTKGGNPQLVLVHYTQGPQTQILPALMNQPVRSYPLRNVNEPSVYVSGDKVGQKIYAPGSAPPPPMPMNMGPMQHQAMVAQQNTNMEMLERRREQERARQRSASTSGRPPRPEDEDSEDDTDQISTRTLAMNRYRRNHDIMNEVFKFAAYGDKHAPPPPRPYSIFNKTEIEEKTARLQEEIEALKAKGAARKAARTDVEPGYPGHRPDVPMDTGGDGIAT